MWAGVWLQMDLCGTWGLFHGPHVTDHLGNFCPPPRSGTRHRVDKPSLGRNLFGMETRYVLQELGDWGTAVMRQWAVLVCGAVATVVLTLLGQGGARTVAGVWIAMLVVACFLVWLDERRRHLFTIEGREMFTDIMRAHPSRMPQIFVTYHVDLKNGRRYASDLVAALIDAGWDAKIWRHPTSNLEINQRGIWVCGEPTETRDLVIAAFSAAQREAKIEPPQQPRFEGQLGIDITLGQIRFPIGR
jgi:hypothetical protein